MTSRAEYRLLLRHDNADARLTQYGYDAGLIGEARYRRFTKKQEKIKNGLEKVKEIRFTPKSEVNEYLQLLGYAPLKEGSVRRSAEASEGETCRSGTVYR